ncbi:LysE family translocator [Streptomyces sp. NPDC047130]|uniref:LysE family translocator n=1 Tax=Streptomyces sp. NPDC047130 TaxID=3155261 RepID=UPI0033CCAC24
MPVDLLGFVGVVLIAYLVPGPDFLVVVRSATEHPARGRAAALGAQTGLCVHLVAAAAGLSLVAVRHPAVFDAVRLLGAAYLVHLGVRALLAARRGSRSGGPEPARGRPGPRGGRSGFAEGFLTNVLNPKAALFFLSVLPQFVGDGDGDGSPVRQILFLGVLDVVIGVVFWFALVAVAAPLRTLLTRPKVRHRWEVTTGWLFIAIGVGVAVAA